MSLVKKPTYPGVGAGWTNTGAGWTTTGAGWTSVSVSCIKTQIASRKFDIIIKYDKYTR